MHFYENKRKQILHKFYRFINGRIFYGSECWALMNAPVILIETAKLCFLDGLQNAVNMLEKTRKTDNSTEIGHYTNKRDVLKCIS
jgi:hypothetical protein